MYSTLKHLKKFFLWLAGQPGYKSQLQYSDAVYFNLSIKDVRIATAHRDRAGPTLQQILHVISTMPETTEIERRNRALIAFTLLTGARDRAIASMKLKNIDLALECVSQDARNVETKFSKSFPTFFFPVGEDVRKIVIDWVVFLRQDKLWGNDDPLFPKTRVEVNPKHQFEPCGFERTHWSDAGPIREVSKRAFKQGGLPYFNPHSFRKALACLGEKLCKTAEEFKAWSQNLGHERPLTTFLSYGAVGHNRQGELIRALGQSKDSTLSSLEEMEALMRKMREDLNKQRGLTSV